MDPGEGDGVDVLLQVQEGELIGGRSVVQILTLTSHSDIIKTVFPVISVSDCTKFATTTGSISSSLASFSNASLSLGLS